MDREDKILKFIDGTATGDECRELLKELRSEGLLGEVLMSDAATFLLYSTEELLQYFSPEEVAEIEAQRATFTASKEPCNYIIGDSASDIRLVAEDEEPYGE